MLCCVRRCWSAGACCGLWRCGARVWAGFARLGRPGLCGLDARRAARARARVRMLCVRGRLAPLRTMPVAAAFGGFNFFCYAKQGSRLE